MPQLRDSVGREATNVPADVVLVQGLMNQVARPTPRLVVNGVCDSKLVAAIEAYQRSLLPTPLRPGVVSPEDTVWRRLWSSVELPKPTNSGNLGLRHADYQAAAADLKVEVPAIYAIALVESRGAAYFPSGRPKILFEAHIFSRRTRHAYDLVAPDISSRTRNKALYVGGEREYPRLERALCLDRTAALESASYGRFQIMGFNHRQVGYPTVDGFVRAMYLSERSQLDAFVQFIRQNHLVGPLQRRDWASVARGYNGSDYGDYDLRLANAYEAARTWEYDRYLRFQGMALA